ncbi:hypothetical protein [Ruegeria jejuensis]|uniref:hypothetical protein n=1 Tax=Ruegeria jejuensis TaxID=3233338 RepID=UPI00355C2F0E
MPFTSDMVNKEWLKQATPDWMNTDLTATDRVAAYFELITGRRLTRQEKIALPAVISGDFDHQ